MPLNFLKQAPPAAPEDVAMPRRVAAEMLEKIEKEGEAACREYCKTLDKYEGDILMCKEEWDRLADSITDQAKSDIQFAHDRVRDFAQAQLDSIKEFEMELSPGVFAGQKIIPMAVAGCYVPGGRYAHIASAIMSVTTARVAGVKTVIMASPTRISGDTNHVDPHILYAARLCGADHVLAIGGVQAIGALRYGLFSGSGPADILVGPGNAFVAEAKRMLFGECGIDIFAGPTEIGIVCDKDCDAEMVATDIVSQAEHGPTSPCWVFSTDLAKAKTILERIEVLLTFLPDGTRETATTSWGAFGEVIVADTREECVEISDKYAAEHLEVLCEDMEWWSKNLRNYGSLFCGEETNVTYGDKASGPNHVLPTKRAARYTGGLSVHKFVKICSFQRMTKIGSLSVGPVAARISRYEGMEGHARAADARLAKYLPKDEVKKGLDEALVGEDRRHVERWPGDGESPLLD